MKKAITNENTKTMTLDRRGTRIRIKIRTTRPRPIWRTPMTTTKGTRRAAIVAASLVLAVLPGQARADDFGKIIHSIESNYHVHRNYRFVMGFAGFMVKCAGGFAGVR